MFISHRVRNIIRPIFYWVNSKCPSLILTVLRFLTNLQVPLSSKKKLLIQLKSAIDNQEGFATGKLGIGPLHFLYYPHLSGSCLAEDKRRSLEARIFFEMEKNTGVYPANPTFCVKWSQFYLDQVYQLDAVGLIFNQFIKDIYKNNRIKNNFFFYDLDPERQIPSSPENCYLQFLQDKKVLLICPFAHLLAERANKETFEAVWSKTGKKWFNPSSVQSVEIPYGFAEETQKNFPTSFDLLEHIYSLIDPLEYDVALIAAAGYAIPIATYIKRQNKVAIDVGGHLQVLFGVMGKRWRESKEYQEKYITDAWIDMPEKYKPKRTDVCDQGAYW